jgi:predicted dehydrogenase
MSRSHRKVSIRHGTRREFLSLSGQLAGASALAGLALPHVHAAGDGTVRLALIGCGGRGSGAVGNALSAPGGPVKLFAMADIFEDRLKGSHKTLSDQFGQKIDVPTERQFIGFDAYRKAIDCLRKGDVAMLTGYTAFRPMQLDYAVDKGVNVFMEKPFAPDPGGVHQIIEAGQRAEKKNLKIAAGLMWRHSNARQAMIQKIRDGAMGQIQLMRAYRMESGYHSGPWNFKGNELLWQLRRRWAFLWASSGILIELMVHQVDECCWIKDAWPVSAHGIGGRIAGSRECGQNLDSYSIEYTFADGTKAQVTGRYLPKCHNEFATYVHGTKCAGQFCVWGAAPILTRTYKDQRIGPDNVAWRSQPEEDPWQMEWNVLLEAIRRDRPHNEARRAACADLASIMGRAAVHSGKVITWEEAMASRFRFCPNVASLTVDSPAPVHADAQGRYPAPIPGACAEI